MTTRRDFLLMLGGAATGLLLPGLTVAATAPQRSPLQRQIITFVQNLRKQGIITRDERTAWSVYDFHDGHKLVSINENAPYQSASMLKPFVAQAYFLRHRQNPGRYPYNSNVRALMERMIRRSSNPATNELIRRAVGGRKPRPQDVEQLLKRHASGIFRELSLVEYIPRSGRSYRNRASARDYSRFLYAMWYDKLPYADEIRHYMHLPNPDRIATGIPAIPQQTEVYDKTGSTARLCGNMGILVGKDAAGRDYPYTMIGIVEKSNRARSYGRWLRSRSQVIRDVSSMVYQEMRLRHNLV